MGNNLNGDSPTLSLINTFIYQGKNKKGPKSQKLEFPITTASLSSSEEFEL